MADAFDPPEHGPLRDTSTMWPQPVGSAATVAVAAALLILNADLGLIACPGAVAAGAR